MQFEIHLMPPADIMFQLELYCPYAFKAAVGGTASAAPPTILPAWTPWQAYNASGHEVPPGVVSIVRAELARQQAEAAGANEAEMQMAAADERARSAWSNTRHCKSRMVQGGRNEQIPSGALADALADGGHGGEGGSFHAVGFEWEYFECKQETANKIWCHMKGLRLSQPVVVQYLVPSVLFLSVSFLSSLFGIGMAMPRVAAATIMLLTLNGLRAQVQEQMPVGGEVPWLEEYFVIACFYMFASVACHVRVSVCGNATPPSATNPRCTSGGGVPLRGIGVVEGTKAGRSPRFCRSLVELPHSGDIMPSPIYLAAPTEPHGVAQERQQPKSRCR